MVRVENHHRERTPAKQHLLQEEINGKSESSLLLGCVPPCDTLHQRKTQHPESHREQRGFLQKWNRPEQKLLLLLYKSGRGTSEELTRENSAAAARCAPVLNCRTAVTERFHMKDSPSKREALSLSSPIIIYEPVCVCVCAMKNTNK